MSDVKRHLSTHDRLGKALYRPVSRPVTADSANEKLRPTDVEQAGRELSRLSGSRDDENELAAPLASDALKAVRS